MVVFYEIWKKYNKIKQTKNKMDLKNRKMNNHPQSPEAVDKLPNKPNLHL